ncbi:NAD(P)-dependent oxidoreductase [Brooklawnia cerclae]|uniref:Phosphoglycerate dehydrogenase-like enzyme n=1 Tax=Brooklawnia cerclae TaxID=349934 RepID=A0ABX0SC04_9ACTN|nr:NAD(P)-dependent oxidoreductase [Brooklawnia cerclae]NIH55516.1 phosphoglycerate dehydrogenase-like enzyme [Brooklawnia cerclae]
MNRDYVVGLTSDAAEPDGSTDFGDIGLERLTAAGLTWRLLPAIPPHGPIPPSALDGVDAVISLGHIPFNASLVRQVPRLRHIARFGAGYDGIDPVALANEGVVLTTTPTGLRSPVALTGLTMILACANRLLENHLITTRGQWNELRGKRRGIGIQGRTVGILGFGSIGSRLAEMLGPLGATIIAASRSAGNSRARSAGVEVVDPLTLAERSDFVVVTASLTDQNRGMIDAAFFAAMQPHAYFINISRGGLADYEALRDALARGGIAGAGLDVFDPEPPAADDPLLAMENVICTPHALSWTEDFTRDVSALVMEAVITVSQGTIPASALARDALDPVNWRGAVTVGA